MKKRISIIFILLVFISASLISLIQSVGVFALATTSCDRPIGFDWESAIHAINSNFTTDDAFVSVYDQQSNISWLGGATEDFLVIFTPVVVPYAPARAWADGDGSRIDTIFTPGAGWYLIDVSAGTVSDKTSMMGSGVGDLVRIPNNSTVTCVQQMSGFNYDASWSEYSLPDLPSPIPPYVAPDPLQWDFTANVTGLNVHFQADTVGIDPTVTFLWDFEGIDNFVDMNPTAAVATDPMDPSSAIYNTSSSDLVDPVSLQPYGYTVATSRQAFDYIYVEAGTYDVGLDTVSSEGVHKFTHKEIIVGGTGFFRTPLQNGTSPDSPVPDKNVCGATDFACIIGQTFSNIFIPDSATIRSDFATLKSSFETHLGFIAYPFVWIATFLSILAGVTGTPTCDLSFGNVWGAPYSLNICILEQSAPTVFAWAQMILLAVISFTVLFKLNDKLQGVLKNQ